MAAASLDEISAHSAYPMSLFKERTGLSDWALMQARKQGLRTVKIGRRRFVRGIDFLDFLERQLQDEA